MAVSSSFTYSLISLEYTCNPQGSFSLVMLMPFAMLYPPNVAALPHVTYPYPHYCNNPRPRFADSPPPREATPSRARATTASSTFSASSTAAPSTPRSRTWSKRPKTPHPTREKEKKERTPFSHYAIAALAGCAQYSAAFPVPTTSYGFFTPTSTDTSRADRRSHSGSATTPTSTTRFTEQFGRQEKVKNKKREKLRSCGRKLGKWIAGLCWEDRDKQESRTIEGSIARLATGQVDEKHETQEYTASGANRRCSRSSDVTLVDSGEQEVREVIARTRTEISPGTVYTGH